MILRWNSAALSVALSCEMLTLADVAPDHLSAMVRFPLR
jgi:hypothetical protein